MANLRCNGISNINGSIANLNGLIDNAPITSTLGFAYGTTPGGPYPNATPHPTVGNVTLNQAFSQTITGLQSYTPYYFVALEYNAANAIIATSGECTFQVAGARDMDCDPPCTVNVAQPIPGVIPPVAQQSGVTSSWTFAALAAGNGPSFAGSQFPDKTVQATGTGTVTVEGSIDGVVWEPLHNTAGVLISLNAASNDIAVILENPVLMRAVVAGGVATVVFTGGI